MEDALAIVIAVVLIVLFLVVIWGPSVIAILKRHYILGAVGLLVFAPVGWVGALLMAKPDSWWARKRYDERKQAESVAKYGEPAVIAAASPATAATIEGTGDDWKCQICGETSATREAAESHVRGSHAGAPLDSSIGQV